MEEWKRLKDQETKRQKVKGGRVGGVQFTVFSLRKVGAGVRLGGRRRREAKPRATWEGKTWRVASGAATLVGGKVAKDENAKSER